MVKRGVFNPSKISIPLTIKGNLPNEPSRPDWMKVKANLKDYMSLKGLLKEKKLNTVCEEASCPNILRMLVYGYSYFYDYGRCCTRACGFCDVKTNWIFRF